MVIKEIQYGVAYAHETTSVEGQFPAYNNLVRFFEEKKVGS